MKTAGGVEQERTAMTVHTAASGPLQRIYPTPSAAALAITSHLMWSDFMTTACGNGSAIRQAIRVRDVHKFIS